MNFSEIQLYFCTIVPIRERWCNRLLCCRSGYTGQSGSIDFDYDRLDANYLQWCGKHQTGDYNIKLEITGEDLRVFSDELINRAINEVALAFRAVDEERLLSREEVKDMCGVCDATLWHWNKRNYLKAVKVGSKVKYRLSDVKRILGGTSKTGDNGSK